MKIQIKGRVFDIGAAATVAERAEAEEFAALVARCSVKGMTDGYCEAQSLVCTLANVEVGASVTVGVLGQTFSIGSNPGGRLRSTLTGVRLA